MSGAAARRRAAQQSLLTWPGSDAARFGGPLPPDWSGPGTPTGSERVVRGSYVFEGQRRPCVVVVHRVGRGHVVVEVKNLEGALLQELAGPRAAVAHELAELKVEYPAEAGLE